MIAIPNMEKPKGCLDCPVNDMACELWMEVANIKTHRHKDCPLIEIVTCGECKWGEEEGDEGEGNLTCACHIPRFIVPSDGFCYLGERRVDEVDDRLLADK